MKRVVIVQARMGSTRLPGKVLENVCGQPMLIQQIRRLQSCTAIDEIVVATTTHDRDEPLVGLARACGVRCFRGHEEDVLARYVDAARASDADVVIRVTGDCPLIDPGVTDAVVNELIQHKTECDYATNVLQRTYPRGLDVEAFFWDTLLRINRLATSLPEREHVTVTVRSERPGAFLSRSVTDSENNSDLRWTVDTQGDLQFVRAIYQDLDLSTRRVPYREMLQYVRSRPELSRLNAGIETWTPG